MRRGGAHPDISGSAHPDISCAGESVTAAAREFLPEIEKSPAADIRPVISGHTPAWAAIFWKSYLPKLYAGRRPADFAAYRCAAAMTADPAPMELPTTTAGPPSSAIRGEDVASGFLTAVGRERGVAVAVAAKIGAGPPVTRSPQGRSEETVPGPQVTHAGHQHHQRAVACDVVADPPLRAAEITGFPDRSHGTGMAGARRAVRRGAHAFIAFGFQPGFGTRRGGLSQLLRSGCPSGRSRAVCRRPSPVPTAAGA